MLDIAALERIGLDRERRVTHSLRNPASSTRAGRALAAYGRSYGYGFERGPKALRDHAQVILHAKWLYKELVTDPGERRQAPRARQQRVGRHGAANRLRCVQRVTARQLFMDRRSHER